MIGAVAIAWTLVYALDKSDSHRAHGIMGFQFMIDLLLAAVLESEVLSKKVVEEEDKVLEKLLRTTEEYKKLDNNQYLGLLTFASGEVLLAAISAPIAATNSEADPS